MIITVEQIEALRPYIENIGELISADDVDALLDAVDDVVVDNIVSHNDEPDEEHSRYGCAFVAVIQLSWLSPDKSQESL